MTRLKNSYLDRAAIPETVHDKYLKQRIKVSAIYENNMNTATERLRVQSFCYSITFFCRHIYNKRRS